MAAVGRVRPVMVGVVTTVAGTSVVPAVLISLQFVSQMSEVSNGLSEIVTPLEPETTEPTWACQLPPELG
jgi:hypothetical protein